MVAPPTIEGWATFSHSRDEVGEGWIGREKVEGRPKQRHHAAASDSANLAMRDAVDLALVITSPEDWRTGVRAYEATTHERGELAAQTPCASSSTTRWRTTPI